MSCNISFQDQIANAIANKIGSVSNIAAYRNVYTRNGEITKAFQDRFTKTTSLPFSEEHLDEIAKFVMDEYNNKRWDVNYATTSTDINIQHYGYSSVNARDIGKQYIQHYINRVRNTNKLLDKTQEERKDQFNRSAVYGIASLLVSRLPKDIGITTVKELNKANIADLEEKLQNAPIEVKNMFALYKEVSTKTKREDGTYAKYNETFFEDLYKNSELGEILRERTITDIEDSQFDILENQDEPGEDDSGVVEDNNDDDTTDGYLQQLDNKSGDKIKAEANFDFDFRSYIASLPNLISTEVTTTEENGKKIRNYQYDTNNEMGVVTYMSPKEVVSTILADNNNYDNVDSFIETVEHIAKNSTNLKGLIQFSDRLRADREFAYRCFRMFNLHKTLKLKVNVQDKEINVNYANIECDKETLLKRRLRKDLNHSSLLYSAELGTLSSELANARKTLTDKTNARGAVRYAKKEGRDVIKRTLLKLFPTIEEYSIDNFIDNNGDTTQANQIVLNEIALIDRLQACIAGAAETFDNWVKRRNRIRSIAAANAAYERESNEVADTTLLESVKRSNIYSDSSTEASYSLGELLSDYVSMSISQNSYNSKKKQTSNFLRPSYISTLNRILNNPKALEAFAAKHFMFKQFDYSNILIEHIDENGNVIHGLFRQMPDGTYQPTEYADSLFKVEQFEAVDNPNLGKVATWADLSKQDFATTQYMVFFNTKSSDYRSEDIDADFAHYFMRIPADKPNNYVFTAPKYRTAGLFIADEESSRAYIEKTLRNRGIIDRAAIPQNLRVNTWGSDQRDIVVDDLAMIKKQRNVAFNELYSDTPYFNLGDVVRTRRKYIDPDGNVLEYVLEGTLYAGNSNNGPVNSNSSSLNLKDYKVYILSDRTIPESLNRTINNLIIEEGYKKGAITKVINKNHAIFRQYKNNIMQELTDIANSLYVMFEQEIPGIVRLGDSSQDYKPIFKEGWFDSKDCPNAYANYHYNDKDKTILKKVNDNWVLTGNCFKSNKLCIAEKGIEIENFGEQLFKEAFDFLTGGATGKYIHTRVTDKGVDVIFTDDKVVEHRNDDGTVTRMTQEECIDFYVEKFIERFIDYSVNKMQEYKEFIPNSLFNEEHITEWALNTYLMYVNYDQLVEGDSKFYKNAQDFFKRAKEGQAGGVSYGIFDPTFDITKVDKANLDDDYNVDVKSPLNSTIFNVKDSAGNVSSFTLKQRKTFTGITISNSVHAVASMQKGGNVYAKIKKQYGENVANNIAEAFDRVKANDAISFITFKEFIRRVALRGELNKYKPLIDAINDETQELTPDIVREFIQLQKNFYYDHNTNTESHITAPRQVKNAEFVLIPRLLRGTELEILAEVMDSADIAQCNTVETTKAGKTNVLTFWNNDGVLTEANLNKFKATIADTGSDAIELFDYTYLYTQLDTPQHLNAKNKAGIQFMKKVLDNLSDPENLRRKGIIFKVYGAKIKQAFITTATKFGVELDENNNLKFTDEGRIVGFDKKAFLDELRNEMKRTGLDSNMLAFTEINPDTGDTNMPLFDVTVAIKVESLAQSIIQNKITRQKLPGFHAAQMTSIGFKANKTTTYKRNKLGEQNNAKTIVTKEEYKALTAKEKKYYDEYHGQIGVSSNLEYHPNAYADSLGNVISEEEYKALSKENRNKFTRVSYTEILLPKNNFNFNRYNIDGSLKSDEQLRTELEIAGLDKIIGYRIPTEGKQSISIMKIKGFIDDAYGSTIVVPDGWVAQTGSDFDIDSIYGINFNSKVENGVITRIPFPTMEELEAMSEKELLALDEKVLENAIINSCIDILQSDEVIEELFGTSNFRDIAGEDYSAREMITGNVKPNSTCTYNPFDQFEYHFDAMSGLKLKGMSVFMDGFCSVCNTTRPIVNPNNIITVVYREKDGYKQEDIESMYDKTEYEVKTINGDKCFVVHHQRYGWSKNNKNVVGKLITSYSSQTTAHILDAIKEGIIPNVNTFTFPVYKLFPSIGSDYMTSVAFMVQPAITELVNRNNSRNSAYQVSYGNPTEAFIKEKCIELAKRKNINIKKADTNTLLSNILSAYRENIERLFGVDVANTTLSTDPSKMSVIPIISHLLQDRYHNKLNNVDDNDIVDLITILQFNKLNALASGLTEYATCLNPDKFGAKQSIFDTAQVFDKITEILKRKESLLKAQDTKGNFVNLLRAVYPGLNSNHMTTDEVIEEFLSTDGISTYPTMYNFMKYASAVSIKINKELFLTKTTNFDNEVRSLNDSFTMTEDESPKLTPSNYSDYTQYILGDFYRRASDVALPFVVDSEGNLVRFDIAENRVLEIDEFNEILEQEKRRVYGFDTLDIDFVCKDINHPTKNELETWSHLSPAQKIYFIQQRAKHRGVFEYIDVDLIGNKYNNFRHSLTYKENANSSEEIYSLFAKAFNNNNPLIHDAAIDIIKYHYLVNGGKTVANGVGKVIKNEAIYNGLSVIDNVKELVINSKIGERYIDYRTFRENFIRANYEKLIAIRRHTVSNKTVSNEYGEPITITDLVKTRYNIIYLSASNPNFKNLVEKYSLAYFNKKAKGYVANDYIILKFPGENNYTLYRIRQSVDDGSLVLYPLNKLENNENSELSINPVNNRFYPSSFYEDVVAEIITEETPDIQDILSQYEEEAKEAKERISTKTTTVVTTLDNPRASDIETIAKLKRDTAAAFKNNPNSVYYVFQPLLTHYISRGQVGVFHVNNEKYEVRLAYFDKGFKDALNKGTIPTQPNEHLMNVLNSLNKYDKTIGKKRIVDNLNFVYTVKPSSESETTSNVRHSTVTDKDFGISSVKTIKNMAFSENDPLAKTATDQFKKDDIKATVDSVTINYDKVINITSNYVHKKVGSLISEIDNFIEDANGNWVPIDSDECLAIIKTDKAQRVRFLKTILDAKRLVDEYRTIAMFEHTSDNPATKRQLDSIQNDINRLDTYTRINNAFRRFATDYLASLSDDPRFKQNIMTIVDSFQTTSGIEAWINDLQESNNSLVQLVAKELTANLNTVDMLASKRRREFDKEWDDIVAEANRNGNTVDINHLIKNGDWITEHSEQFVKDYNDLVDAQDLAAATYGENSIQHLEAQLNLKKWKLNHINQVLKDDYYQKEVELIAEILYSPYKKVFSMYKQLEKQRRDILEFQRNGKLDDANKAKLDRINQEIDNLTTEYYTDIENHTIVKKVALNQDDVADFLREENGLTGEKAVLFSLEATNALLTYINGMRALNDKYYTYDTNETFDAELDKHLKVIRTYEKYDRNGNLITPIETLLENHPDYAESKEWLAYNASYRAKPEIQQKVSDAFSVFNQQKKGRSVLFNIARTAKARDDKGFIDATKLTAEQIAKVKNYQALRYGIFEDSQFSDRSLISNGIKSDDVFNDDFYNGMRTNQNKSGEYYETVTEINKILSKYWNSQENIIETALLSEEDIDSLILLYSQLDELKTGDASEEKKEEVKKFIEDNVEFKVNTKLYNQQAELARERNKREPGYYKKWMELMIENRNGINTINHYIFGYCVPSAKNYHKFVDKQRTEALKTIKEHTRTLETPYYTAELRRRIALREEERAAGNPNADKNYQDWYDANHIYNPHTHTTVPVDCWTYLALGYTTNNGDWVSTYQYEPAYAQKSRRPKDGKDVYGNPDGSKDMTNHDHKYGYTINNFKKGGKKLETPNSRYTDTKDYSNPDYNPNEYEIRLKNLILKTMQELIHLDSGIKWMNNNHLPAQRKKEELTGKKVAKELGKLVGWVDMSTSSKEFRENIDYAHDDVTGLPLLEWLVTNETPEIDYTTPVKENGMSDKDYYNLLLENRRKRREQEAKRKEIHAGQIDDNWKDVMDNFILNMCHFNAKQEEKYLGFFAIEMLKSMQSKKRVLMSKKLKRDKHGVIETEDTQLINQFQNWFRRYLYDQYKEETNPGLIKAANIVQSLTSAKFMTFNITGGVANVLVGKYQIIAEGAARDVLPYKAIHKGLQDYALGMASYAADSYKDKATTVQSAIAKFFNVLDYGELEGVVRTPDLEDTLQKIRDFEYSPLHMGEHLMQIGAGLFGALASHRLYFNADWKINGKPKYEYKNLAEVVRDSSYIVLESMLDEKEKKLWEEFKTYELRNDNSKVNYTDFREDLAAKFSQIYLKDRLKEYNQKREEYIKQAKIDFENDELHPTLRSELVLGENGIMEFKQGGKLESMGADAYKLLGQFKQRVISINKKIHGNYGKLDAAQLEKFWYGSLLMQYHKHIYPGIMKRYRRIGYYNEERGTVEKGAYQSLIDFLAMPLRNRNYVKKLQKDTGMTDSELQNVKGIQNIFKTYIDFFTHYRLYKDSMSEYDKANIRRAMGDIYGVLAAICLSVAIQCIADDNDDKGFLYNFMIYESDRLAAESFMYNPFGAASEARKLWSSPVAAMSGAGDLLNTMGLISQYIIQGDEFDATYTSGLYAGENKVKVKLMRNIPLYHSINMLSRLDKNNKYYKLGETALTVIPTQSIAEWISD